MPLLRPGFRPTDAYTVSFVYLHAGSPFLKKGDMRMMLPRMDLPVTLVEWEVFVPEMYRVDRFDGNVIPADLAMQEVTVAAEAISVPQIPGTIVGRVVDQSGAAIPGANVVAQVSGGRWNVVTDANGRYQFDGLPAGLTSITAQLQGFKTMRQTFANDQRGQQLDFSMVVGGVEETVTVSSSAVTNSTRRPGFTHRAKRSGLEPKRSARCPGERTVGQRAEPAAAGVGRAAGAHRGAARRVFVSFRQATRHRSGGVRQLPVSPEITTVNQSSLHLVQVPSGRKPWLDCRRTSGSDCARCDRRLDSASSRSWHWR